MVSMQRDLTTSEAALLLRCSQGTVIRACDQGILEFYRLPGSNFRRLPLPPLLEYMRKHSIPIPACVEHPGGNVAEASCEVEVEEQD